MKKQIIATVFFFSLFALSANLFAQKPEGHKGKFKEARKEIRAYAEQNILPVMQPQREKLDAVLSPAEKQEVEAVRAGLKAQREEMKAKFKELKQDGKKREDLTDEQKAEMRAFHKERRLLMDRAWAVVDANETDIFRLLDAVEEDQKQWREDIHEIMKKNREEVRAEKGEKGEEMEKRGPHKGHGRHHKGGKGGSGGLMELNKPVGFLLWDGEMPEEREFKGQRGEAGPQFDNTVFPNPASNANQLRYTLEKSGPVTITLMDSEGASIRTLVNTIQDAGTYTETFDLGSLSPGVYYYKIRTREEQKVQRFLIEK